MRRARELHLPQQLAGRNGVVAAEPHQANLEFLTLTDIECDANRFPAFFSCNVNVAVRIFAAFEKASDDQDGSVD